MAIATKRLLHGLPLLRWVATSGACRTKTHRKNMAASMRRANDGQASF